MYQRGRPVYHRPSGRATRAHTRRRATDGAQGGRRDAPRARRGARGRGAGGRRPRARAPRPGQGRAARAAAGRPARITTAFEILCD